MQFEKQSYHFWSSYEINNLLSVIQEQKTATGKNRVNWKIVKDKFNIKNCSMEQIKAQYYNLLHDMRHNKQRVIQKMDQNLLQNMQYQKQQEQNITQSNGTNTSPKEEQISIDKLKNALQQIAINNI